MRVGKKDRRAFCSLILYFLVTCSYQLHWCISRGFQIMSYSPQPLSQLFTVTNLNLYNLYSSATHPYTLTTIDKISSTVTTHFSSSYFYSLFLYLVSLFPSFNLCFINVESISKISHFCFQHFSLQWEARVIRLKHI